MINASTAPLHSIFREFESSVLILFFIIISVSNRSIY
nr:MAG TPA: hypothetical protein [Caudoviricetes sp.]